MPSDKEIIEALKGKLVEYEEILKALKAGEKVICKVVAGPLKIEGDNSAIWARVEAGNGEKVVAVGKALLFDKPKDIKFEIGDEVVVLQDNIVDVIPKSLKPAPKKLKVMTLTNWQDIGGYGSQIDRIRNAVEAPLKNAKLAKEFGVTPLKGAVLYGPPGCGKTLIAKALASTLLEATRVDERAFVYIKGPEILSHLVSIAEKRISAIFASCRAYFEETGKQAVVFIDEADAILNRRGSRHSSDVDQTIVPAFLAEMDGLENGNPFVLLATNRLSSLDPAIIREGRIDLKIEITRPDLNDVADIFNIHLKNVKIAGNALTLARVGADAIYQRELKESRSGAMIQTVVKLAASRAMLRFATDRKGCAGITEEDIEASVDSIQYVATDSITDYAAAH